MELLIVVLAAVSAAVPVTVTVRAAVMQVTPVTDVSSVHFSEGGMYSIFEKVGGGDYSAGNGRGSGGGKGTVSIYGGYGGTGGGGGYDNGCGGGYGIGSDGGDGIYNGKGNGKGAGYIRTIADLLEFSTPFFRG